MAAERDTSLACPCCLGAALPRVAAVPRQWLGDGRIGDSRDHDRGVARRALACVARSERTASCRASRTTLVCALVRYRRTGPRHLRTHPVWRTRDTWHGRGGGFVGGTGRA